MSRLEELIQELCPNGVEYKLFYDCCSYVRGITYKKGQESKNSTGIGVLRANNITLEQNTLNFDDVKFVDTSVKVQEKQWLRSNDILICAGSGSKEHIGKVAFVYSNLEYTFGGFMGVIRCNNQLILPRYVFHLLTSSIFKSHLMKASGSSSSTINNINNGTWKDFCIPIPPLPVQAEIVRILDNFTELTARKKQYEYYLQSLLLKDSPLSNKMQLGDIYDFKYGKGNNIPCDGGIYPVYGGNGIAGYHSEYNSEDAPVIGHIGAYAGLVKWAQGKHFVTYNGVICRHKNNRVNKKFAYYLLLTQDFLSEQKGAQPFVSYDALKKPLVNVPPLAEQERIVAILDRFDTLCNDISEGLPAEIEARQKQYEYYRDQLLTFKKLP